MNEIRIAIVGLGKRGTLAWIPLLQKIKGCRITAICDPITALHADARAQLANAGDVKVHTRYEDVLADRNVDAVGLTVRCREQGAMAAMALEAGKHVNQEVPVAHSIEDCWRIVVAQERSGTVFQSAEQVRYAGYVQEWQKLVAAGALGKITYAEGQYLHYIQTLSFRDRKTGQLIPVTEIARYPDAERTWFDSMAPIHYLVHDLSPLLKVLDDRVVEVVGMSTDSPSAAHPELRQPDFQVALMRTARGAILRMAVSFSQPHPHADTHWLQVIGTKGAVEWKRSAHDKAKAWFASEGQPDKRDTDWSYERTDASDEARASGHWGLDYHVHTAFRDAVLEGKPLEFDVYRAMDVAAAGILAAESIAQGSRPLRVPDFRPNQERPAGAMPAASTRES
jgi:predicted dehydrogenase